MDNSALFRISYGMYVMTASDSGCDNGCVINAAIQVSDAPPQVLAVLNKKHRTHEMVTHSHRFNLSVLSQKAPLALYQHFGFQSGREVDKFAGFSQANRAFNGVLYLTEGVNAFLSADVERQIDIGSHTIFLGRVTDGAVLSDDPSATYDYYQQHLKPSDDGHGYVCRVCGYRYSGEVMPPDFVCPICGHGSADFEPVS